MAPVTCLPISVHGTCHMSAVDSRATWIDDFESGKRPCHHHVQETELITSERDGYFVKNASQRFAAGRYLSTDGVLDIVPA